jgi:CTP:molybdopterin cytidylyltransferase MocA
MALAGIVLAAGLSAKMGFPKALLDFRGETFVVRVLQALEALDLKAPVVVLGSDAVRIRPVLAAHDCVVVERAETAGGQTGSLRAALGALRPRRPTAALVWPVDRPHVRIATVERLIAAHGSAPGDSVVPVFGGRHGRPMILGAPMLARLTALPEGAELPAEEWSRGADEVAVDDPAVIDPIDVPEDYERLVRAVNRDRC